MKPRDAKTVDDVCRLQTDNYPNDPKRIGTIFIDGPLVHIYGAPNSRRLNSGEVASVSMPRKDFMRIVDWYQRDQVERKR